MTTSRLRYPKLKGKLPTLHKLCRQSLTHSTTKESLDGSLIKKLPVHWECLTWILETKGEMWLSKCARITDIAERLWNKVKVLIYELNCIISLRCNGKRWDDIFLYPKNEHYYLCPIAAVRLYNHHCSQQTKLECLSDITNNTVICSFGNYLKIFCFS